MTTSKPKKLTKAEKADWAKRLAEQDAQRELEETQQWEARLEAEQAKGGLSARIAELLKDKRFKSGEMMTARQIAKALGVDKHDVNKVLYGAPEVYGFASGPHPAPLWFRKRAGEGSQCQLIGWEEHEERLDDEEEA